MTVIVCLCEGSAQRSRLALWQAKLYRLIVCYYTTPGGLFNKIKTNPPNIQSSQPLIFLYLLLARGYRMWPMKCQLARVPIGSATHFLHINKQSPSYGDSITLRSITSPPQVTVPFMLHTLLHYAACPSGKLGCIYINSVLAITPTQEGFLIK